MNTYKKIVILQFILVVCALIVMGLSLFHSADMKKELEVQEEAWAAEKEEYQQEIADLKQKIEELSKPEIPVETPIPTEAPEPKTSFLENLDETEAGVVLEEKDVNTDDLSVYFTACDIVKDDGIYQRINGQSYRENDNISLEQLAYMKVLHYNFEQKIQVGELIVNKALVTDMQEIFQELFENKYEIQSLYLIDNYWTGDGNDSDFASIEENNSSAFCYRTISGGGGLSNHAYGRAIDINPQQNPYVWYDGAGGASWSHSNADLFIDRTSGYDHVITHEDLCCQLFMQHGFTWGGDWGNPKDYQHFEKNKAQLS